MNYKNDQIADAQANPDGGATPFQQQSSGLPRGITFTVASQTTVYLLWRDDQSGEHPTAGDVANRGFPLTQGRILRLDWNPEDGDAHDPSRLFMATFGAGGDLRAIV